MPRLLAMKGPQGQAIVLPAYDHVLKASHLFNKMDSPRRHRRRRAPELHRAHPRPDQDVRRSLGRQRRRERVMFEHAGQTAATTARSRSLKRRATWTERRLWEELRKLGVNFRRQAPIGRYFADFACHARKLVVEVDGGIHERLAAVALRDLERQQWLEGQGYRVLRFTDQQVRADAEGCAHKVQALLLDGGGLGGGVATESTEELGWAPTPTGAAHPDSLRSPPSPTLPPSRRKGVSLPSALGKGE